jgi:tetratricopeptide (TPR) repeat protein
LSEAIRLKPDTARAYCNRALAYMEKSDYDNALNDLTTGIQKDARLPLCYFVRGNLYSKKEDYQKAIEDYTQALQLKPDNPGELVKRGEAYEHLGERDKALADFKAAVAIAPGFKEAEQGVKRLSQD